MSPSSVFVSGLNFEKIRQVMYALRDDIELSQVYFSAVYLVEEFYTLIATEMRSVKKDISYWQRLAESNHWEIYLTQLHNKTYRRMVLPNDDSFFSMMSRTFPLSICGIQRLFKPSQVIEDCQESIRLLFLSILITEHSYYRTFFYPYYRQNCTVLELYCIILCYHCMELNTV